MHEHDEDEAAAAEQNAAARKTPMENLHIASVKTFMPPSVRAVKWVRNHHFIELEDEHGNATKLLAGGVLLGECAACQAACIALQNNGKMRCTHCGGAVKWQWAKPQLAFIPEHESQFFGWDRGKNPAEERKQAKGEE